MVDFQSRDTRRGVGDDGDETDETDEATSDETAADESEPADAAESVDETESADETGGDDAETVAADAGDAEGEPTDAADTDGEPTDATRPAADTGSSDTPDPLDDDASPDSETAPDTDATTGADPSDDSTTRSTTSDTAQSAERRLAGGAAGSKVATGSQQAGADQSSPAVRPVDVALVTVGTTTGQGSDPTGEALATAIESAGHSVTARERLRGDYDGIQQAVDTVVGRDDVEVVVTAGGVGIEPSEATIEAVHPLFEKALPGFGEAFRTLLFEHIGTGIVAVRSTAGIADGTPVFCLPADAEAATLAVDEIIATEAPELVAHLQ
ncbi:molybdenum cofactor biosynthesis protein MoaB [Halomicroarcula sp. F13]|uniref:Molybdenum cofactor biosynthesis protein MoaB n=1 Tax=Haloarcula rubra TaxID=2487747 RepID=A0AAW4PRF0_9EURY|nr:molybdopterin-binding protein [Halomicroarcula rubra]MBX0323719.1 molybdenum cofactor biosynthesis protein MoaB [Halomicroarcula rubra]